MPFSAADPIQPFWVLNSESYLKKKSKIPAIAHFYKFESGSGIASSCAVPDGAVDIIIECGADRLNARICGPVSQGAAPGFEEHKTYFGIRLHTEAMDHVGDAPISDLVGRVYSLDDLTQNRDFLEALAEEEDFVKQTAIFEKHFQKYSETIDGSSPAHQLTAAIIDAIYRRNGIIRVGELEQELHYTRRHLARCFSGTMGMSIKTFADYVRFQYILHGLRDGRFEKASDAAMAGNYSDQSHFQKDFRRFTNTTPRRMIRLFQENDYANRIVLVE